MSYIICNNITNRWSKKISKNMIILKQKFPKSEGEERHFGLTHVLHPQGHGMINLPFRAFFRWRSSAARSSWRSGPPSGWGKAAGRWSAWRSHDSGRSKSRGVRSRIRGRGCRPNWFRPRLDCLCWPTSPSTSDEDSALKNIKINIRFWKSLKNTFSFRRSLGSKKVFLRWLSFSGCLRQITQNRKIVGSNLKYNKYR